MRELVPSEPTANTSGLIALNDVHVNDANVLQLLALLSGGDGFQLYIGTLSSIW